MLIVKSWSHVTLGLFSKIEVGSRLGKFAPSLPLVKEGIMTLEELMKSELPLNRKERFFTGTVSPMIVCRDNFKQPTTKEIRNR